MRGKAWRSDPEQCIAKHHASKVLPQRPVEVGGPFLHLRLTETLSSLPKPVGASVTRGSASEGMEQKPQRE
jgi:hypothetical protein